MTALSDFTTAFETFIAAAATFAGATEGAASVTSGTYTARVNDTVLTRVGSTISETPTVAVADLVANITAYVAANPTHEEFQDVGNYRLQMAGGELFKLEHE